MVCCFEEEEDTDTLQQPLHNPQTQTQTPNPNTPSTSNSNSNTTISPMNSNFPALTCKDILQTIFENLSVPDLARCACVCKVWSEVAGDGEIVVKAFKEPWKLKEVIGKPSSGGFWRDGRISKFAVSHRVVKGDSVASLAVKYSVQVMDIKRLNNMMSDHGIHSRDRLLIPVSTPDILIDGTCYIEVDAHAKREVAVLYLEGAPDSVVTRALNTVTSERGKRRIIDSLRRSMHVDDGTAEYYLSLSNGDPRGALMEFSEDIRWERQMGLS
ncbi:F-box domain, cyclin-like protein [Artemisia annua]|uniref:F-box domain, cyclin-like protein n=1 Tax=Artemisia annua TaxID=35608 RepID=A0A2U1PNY0_ARTAN|nr:F-box domain, cyclin-like protein [Artemisia annua]